jgi:predicted Zn-ribbon and HTH transcriptional regulator
MACLEMADVMRRFGPAYLEKHGERMLPSHRQAIRDILNCRTAALGGHAWRCQDCERTFFVYHGCRNRSCPACHSRQIQEWLEARQAELFDCPYYHITVTVPEGLRAIFRSNQRLCYDLLMKTAAEAVLELAGDSRQLGALVGILAVLHTWTTRMDYHPHVHLLVTGGGADPQGEFWRPSRPGFLVPTPALWKLVRGKLRSVLERDHPELYAQIPVKVWVNRWVADCRHWGRGEKAVLEYLARYVFRVALTNRRIVAMDEQTVTFRWKDRKAKCWRTQRVSGEEFLRRFLQHVLPKGFNKVRYYGLWHPARRKLAAKVRAAMYLQAVLQGENPAPNTATRLDPNSPDDASGHQGDGDEDGAPDKEPACPHCKSRKVHYLGEVPPDWRRRLMDP